MAAQIMTDAPAMGLRGLWRDIANLSAVALVCVMFYQSQADARQQLREDRAAARAFEAQTLHSLQAIQETQAETARTLRILVHEIRKGNQT